MTTCDQTADKVPMQIPEWFIKNMKDNIGTWVTDNSRYQSAEEPYTTYGMTWEWGLGETSIVGRLYGYIGDQQSGDFWQFRQFWDNVDQKGVLMQFGYGGVNGIGNVHQSSEGLIESVQTFSLPDGKSWVEKHLTLFKEDSFETTSYQQEKDGAWTKKRSYLWKKV